MQFMDWAVQARTLYAIAIPAWIAQYVNCHIALKTMFYLLINWWLIYLLYEERDNSK